MPGGGPPLLRWISKLGVWAWGWSGCGFQPVDGSSAATGPKPPLAPVWSALVPLARATSLMIARTAVARGFFGQVADGAEPTLQRIFD